jgi:HK97 family phage major capsid protein
MELADLQRAIDAQHAASMAALTESRTANAALQARLDEIETKLNRPRVAVSGGFDADTKAQTAAAFTKFVRFGRESLSHDEARLLLEAKSALTVTNDATGGYLAPEQFMIELLRNLVLFSPVRSIARVAQMGAAFVKLPRRTGTLTAAWVTETGHRPQTQPAYGQTTYVADESACYVDISNALLEDSAFDMGAELAFDFAEEFGRLEGAAFVSGDGIGKPAGFMSNDSITSVNSGHASQLTADGLIDLYHALPTFYAANAVWVMNRATLGAARKLKNGSGDYLLAQAGIANAPNTTLLGRPVVELPDMPDVAAGAYPVAFGDFMQGYRIFDRTQLAVLRDPYSVQTNGLVRFHARRRVAGGVSKAEAIKKLKIST